MYVAVFVKTLLLKQIRVMFRARNLTDVRLLDFRNGLQILTVRLRFAVSTRQENARIE